MGTNDDDDNDIRDETRKFVLNTLQDVQDELLRAKKRAREQVMDGDYNLIDALVYAERLMSDANTRLGIHAIMNMAYSLLALQQKLEEMPTPPEQEQPEQVDLSLTLEELVQEAETSDVNDKILNSGKDYE